LADECGGSLAPVLVVLSVGVLLLSPFLAHVSTRMLASRGADAETLARYASDSGVEWGAWSMLNNSGFRATVDANALTPVALTPSISLNGLTINTRVTAVLVPGWDSTSLADAPDTVDRGGNLAATGGDYIYAFHGKSKDFWRYSISANQWVARADVPTNPDNGSALVYAGAYGVYAFTGKGKHFYRYDPSSNTWTTLSNAPETADQGASLVYTGGNVIYAFTGKSKKFWLYSITSDTWTALADAPDTTVNGGSMIWTGGNYLYVMSGKESHHEGTFWRYSISGDSWTTLATTPGTVGLGGGLAYASGDYIYAMAGDSTDFWRYSLSGDIWTDLTSDPTPGTVQDGGNIVYGGGNYFYALQGNNTADFWRHLAVPPQYDIESKTATSDACTVTRSRLEIDGSVSTVLFWMMSETALPCS
jgi:hypothetical protein